MKPTIAKELVFDALMMAVWRRKPTQEVIVHSDQGSPNTAAMAGRDFVMPIDYFQA